MIVNKSIVRRNIFSKQIGTFFICLIVSALLWIVHALNANYKQTISVPVTFLNLPNNKLIVGELPEKLDITIKTSGLKLLLMSFNGINNNLEIDFNTLKTNAKSQAYSISNGHFNLKNAINFDVEVLKVRPDTLFFTLNKGLNKLVPIKLNINAKLKQGYSIVSKPNVTPAFVNITGDSASIKNIDTVYTQLVKLVDLSENYTENISLKRTLPNVSYNLKEVKLFVEVDRLIEASVNVPITIVRNENNKNIKPIPNQVEIKYLVSMKDYDNIEPNSFKVVVDYSDIENNQHFLDVKLTVFPSGIKIVSVLPEKISYLIYK